MGCSAFCDPLEQCPWGSGTGTPCKPDVRFIAGWPAPLLAGKSCLQGSCASSERGAGALKPIAFVQRARKRLQTQKEGNRQARDQAMRGLDATCPLIVEKKLELGALKLKSVSSRLDSGRQAAPPARAASPTLQGERRPAYSDTVEARQGRWS